MDSMNRKKGQGLSYGLLILLCLMLFLAGPAVLQPVRPALAQSGSCYTLDRGVTPTGSGNITVSPPPNCPNGTQYLYGTILQVTAIPYGGATFSYWSGDASTPTNPTTVAMYGPRAVTAHFNQTTCFSLTQTVTPNGGGSLSVYPPPNCSNGTQYQPGTIVQMTASPSAGYNFSNWSGNATGTVNPYQLIMDGPKWVTANFSRPCYTLNRGVTPDGSGSIAAYPPPNCPNGTQYQPGTLVQLTAYPGPGYSFSGWSGAAYGTANPFLLSMDGTKAVTANFYAPCYNLDRSVMPPGSGTITVNPAPNCANGSQYLPGSIVEMSANPAPGYAFTNWSGSAFGTVNPFQIIVDGPKSAIANFTAPTPVINLISPDMILKGGPAFTLSIGGTNFAPGSKVRWNGSDLVTQYLNPQALEAVVPAGYISGPGIGWVQVAAPVSGGGLVSDPSGVAVGEINPAPVLQRAIPPFLPARGQPASLLLVGRNFTSGAVVYWNGAPLPTTFLKSTQLLAAVPGAALGQISTAQVAILNPAPGGGVSAGLPVGIMRAFYLPVIRKP